MNTEIPTTLSGFGPDGKPIQLSLSEEPLTIGSSEDAVWRISDAGVSPIHCALRLYQGKCVLKDLGSDSGTFVNDKRVDLVTLYAGDRVRVGKVTFEVTNAPTRKGDTTLMREAMSELERGKQQGKGFRTMLGEVLVKDRHKPRS